MVLEGKEGEEEEEKKLCIYSIFPSFFSMRRYFRLDVYFTRAYIADDDAL